MKRHCLTLDLKDDPKAIASYDEYHRNVWPEIQKSLGDSGINSMQIYRAANRLFMIIEVTGDFTFERKAKLDAANPKVQEWETLMSNYQQRLPFAKPDEKWVAMEKVFQYNQD
jgi:L-rhamnose mutarotase